MPGRRNAPPIDSTLCRRCQVLEPAITVRNEALCKPCFCKYVSTKVVKRLETFRVRHAEPGHEPTLLLPLSFGCGSVSLLYVLSQHLQGQVEKTGRTGFRLHVLHIQEDDASAESSKYEGLLDRVKSRFPEHTYSTLPLSDVLSSHHLPLLTTAHTTPPTDEHKHNQAEAVTTLQNLLASTDSATSATDLHHILQRKLITTFAKTHAHAAILWGHSTTRLAERTLAETAKGRGFSLPWVVADGVSPFGIPFHYPLRDLLSKEIASFTTLIDPPLTELIVPTESVKPSVNLKNTTIDDLMRQYFESVEREFPSIVANVVKTTGKLRVPALEEVERECELCEMPLQGRAPERSRLCFGCIRTMPRAAG